MLNSITNFIESIGEFISSIVNFVIDFVNDLLYVIELVGSTVTKIPDLLNWLPVEIIAMFIGIFAIVVVYKIIGREG